MLNSFKYITFILISFNFSSCLYLQNRAKDTSDIFTIGLEQKTAGASIYFWKGGGGIQYGKYGEGIGLRNGHIGIYKTGGSQRRIYGNGDNTPFKISSASGNSYILINTYEHRPISADYRNRKKYYRFRNVFFLKVFLQDDKPTPFIIETSFGLYYGIRLGINVSELLDFLFGIANLDIMEDDLIEEDLEEIKNIEDFKKEVKEIREKEMNEL
ncbi:MAG: hypothetical protein KDK36_09305 [Leptospiraceae bacterium]|nr:hypothetical protein [Leptospiraceae bacterium]